MLPLREAADVVPSETPWRRVSAGAVSVRLPRSSGRRGAITYTQVLKGLSARPGSGAGIEGPYFRPGAWIPEAKLRAREGEAAVAELLVVEQTEIEGPWNAARRCRRWEALYIVWRWAGDLGAWEEVARTSGDRALIVAELRAIAERALRVRTWRIVPTVGEAAERIRDTVERQLTAIEREQRAAVLAILHDQVAAWMVEED
jgi:hypothetical protein